MADTAQTAGALTGKSPTVSGDGIVIDKNKTADQYTLEAEAKYIIPKLVREKFPDLIKLIYETESMNEEERQYWLQILPIMTEDQIKKFADILINEKQQLEKLDKEYTQEMARVGQPVAEIDEAKLREKMQAISQKEEVSKQEDASKAEALLGQLDQQ